MTAAQKSITYSRAPLVEVAISVQFDTPRRLTQALLGAYWASQRERFPTVHSTQGLPATTITTIDAGSATGFEAAPDAIATSCRADHAAVWDECIDSLLAVWNGRGAIPEPVPSNAAIDAAIRFMKDMRRKDPTNTPISIVPALSVTPDSFGPTAISQRGLVSVGFSMR